MFQVRRSFRLLFSLLILGSPTLASPAVAQNSELEQDVQIRMGAAVRKKLDKDWMVQLSPQLRTDGLNPDRYLLELEGGYEPIKYIDLRAAFRGDVEETKRGVEHGYRAGASITGSLPLADFKPSLRVFTTYAFGPEIESAHLLRYRAKIDYKVPGIRLVVSPAVEVFQQLEGRGLYKMRYSLALDYKFMKSKKVDHFIYGGYAFDYFLDEPRNLHIPEIGYKVVFE